MKRRSPQRTTVPPAHPPRRVKIPQVSRPKPQRRVVPKLPPRHTRPAALKPVRPKPVVARIVDDAEQTLVDILDNLLHQGVMLNAEVILALANVDLVYLRLSALLCAADRVLPTRER